MNPTTYREQAQVNYLFCNYYFKINQLLVSPIFVQIYLFILCLAIAANVLGTEIKTDWYNFDLFISQKFTSTHITHLSK